MLPAPPASDRYCILAVRDPEALQRKAVQIKYQQVWGRVLAMSDFFARKLERNPWMSKIIALENHGNILDDSSSGPHVWNPRLQKQNVSSPTSVLQAPGLDDVQFCGHGGSLQSGYGHTSALQNDAGYCKSPATTSQARAHVKEKGSDWSTALDANSTDEVLSCLSLQSLARLSCVSKRLRGLAQPKLLAPSVLVEIREDLGAPYEPSMLSVPLRAADLPAVQKWDRYSVYHDLMSKLYKDIADASDGGLIFQRSLT